MDYLDRFTPTSARLLKALEVPVPQTPPISCTEEELQVLINNMISEEEATGEHCTGRITRAPAAKQIPVRSKR